MRLIDADYFKEQIAAAALKENVEPKKGIALMELVDVQPTAYDVDKVISQIEKSSTDEDGVICYVDKKPVITKETVIKIIKSVGIL